MKRYYHILRIDYIPARYVSSVVYTAGKALVNLRDGRDFTPLDVLAYDRALEVSDEIDDTGRLYSASFSATLADDFDPSPLKLENVLLRVTDTEGVERLVGSLDFIGVVTTSFSNSVAAGTLGQVMTFSATQQYDALPIEYREYTPPGRFTVVPSLMTLAAGQSLSARYSMGISQKKKVTVESTSQYVRAYLRGDRLYVLALRTLPANVTIRVSGTDAVAVVRVNGGTDPFNMDWDFSAQVPVFGMPNASFDGKIYTN